MVRVARSIIAVALACSIGGSAAASSGLEPLCTSAGGRYPNPSCDVLGRTPCIVTPGCLWNSSNIYRGVCTGGPACTYQTLESTCDALLSCSWVPARDAVLETTNCTGDGSRWANPLCNMYERDSCIVSGGCNWNGTNIYGGWCSGGLQCTFQVTPIGCVFTPLCQWVAAREVAPLPRWSGEIGRCHGDHTPSQNPTCRLYTKSTCIFTPGCNWNRRNMYNGWCSGGDQCTYVVSARACAATIGCGWVPADMGSVGSAETDPEYQEEERPILP